MARALTLSHRDRHFSESSFPYLETYKRTFLLCHQPMLTHYPIQSPNCLPRYCVVIHRRSFSSDEYDSAFIATITLLLFSILACWKLFTITIYLQTFPAFYVCPILLCTMPPDESMLFSITSNPEIFYIQNLELRTSQTQYALV